MIRSDFLSLLISAMITCFGLLPVRNTRFPCSNIVVLNGPIGEVISGVEPADAISPMSDISTSPDGPPQAMARHRNDTKKIPLGIWVRDECMGAPLVDWLRRVPCDGDTRHGTPSPQDAGPARLLRRNLWGQTVAAPRRRLRLRSRSLRRWVSRLSRSERESRRRACKRWRSSASRRAWVSSSQRFTVERFTR